MNKLKLYLLKPTANSTDLSKQIYLESPTLRSLTRICHFSQSYLPCVWKEKSEPKHRLFYQSVSRYNLRVLSLRIMAAIGAIDKAKVLVVGDSGVISYLQLTCVTIRSDLFPQEFAKLLFVSTHCMYMNKSLEQTTGTWHVRDRLDCRKWTSSDSPYR